MFISRQSPLVLIKDGGGMMIFRIIVIFILLNSLVYGLNMDEKYMKQNWEKLFTHWASKQIEFWNNGKLEKFTTETTCKGVDSSELDSIKKYYTNIPNALLESLSICNESNRWLGFNGWGLLYGTNEILETSKSFVKSPKSDLGSYKLVGEGITNPKTLFPKEWIPFFDWNGMYIVAIDMLSTNKGQVIIVSIENSMVYKWANSYEEWFELVVSEVLNDGELQSDTIEKLMGIRRDVR